MSSLFDTAYREAWWAFLAAGVLAWAIVPAVRAVAIRLGAVDVPNDARRVHERPTPRLGGVAILLAILISSAWFVDWGATFGLGLLDERQMVVVLLCAAGVGLLGAVDDVLDLPWRVKLLGQIVLALAVILLPTLVMPAGLPIERAPLVVNVIDLPIVRPVDIPVVIGVALATLWIVAMMNMFNFIDGVDGLAAGQAAIIGSTFAIIAASYGRINVAVLAAALAGAALGFLPHNWSRGGARIFMGDSGSMLLGFLLAVISVQGVLKTTAAISLVIPIALLAVPILDTSFVVLKRMKYGVSVANADRWHLHHRLLNVGLTPRWVAAALWSWTAAMSAVALALRFVDYGNSNDWNRDGLVVLAAVVGAALAVTLLLAYRLEILKSRRVRERNRSAREQRNLG